MSDNLNILICEDDKKIQLLAEQILMKKAGHMTKVVSSGEECLEEYSNKYDVVLLDIQLPGISGLKVLKKLKAKNNDVVAIIMTAFSTENLVIDCLRYGAYNYLKKPFEIDFLISSVNEAGGVAKSLKLGQSQSSYSNSTSFSSTQSNIMKELETKLSKVAGKKVSVLLTGESGTGKEYYAKYLHKNGDRSGKAFVDINCPAIPENLFESELFGHEKGAFTGADKVKKGRFEDANEGVVFLDEVADLTHNSQSKLLRVLQERNIVRVGGNQTIPVDIQVISATSRDLKGLIQNEDFRSDLFYRICDIEIEIPPLRSRLEDIPNLIDYFITEYAKENNELKRSFEEDLVDYLFTYDWPGNIRELKSTIRRLLILNDSETIKLEQVQEDLQKHFLSFQREDKEEVKADKAPKENANMQDNEKDHIIAVMKENDYNLSASAKALGIGRSTLYRKIKKYGINS